MALIKGGYVHTLDVDFTNVRKNNKFDTYSKKRHTQQFHRIKLFSQVKKQHYISVSSALKPSVRFN